MAPSCRSRRQLSAGATVQQSLQIVAGMAAALFVIALFLKVGARQAGTPAVTR